MSDTKRKYKFAFLLDDGDLHEMKRLANLMGCKSILDYIYLCVLQYSAFIVKSMEEQAKVLEAEAEAEAKAKEQLKQVEQEADKVLEENADLMQDLQESGTI